MVKNPPADDAEMWAQFLGWEDPLEKEMATHFSILTWKIPQGHKEREHAHTYLLCAKNSSCTRRKALKAIGLVPKELTAWRADE